MKLDKPYFDVKNSTDVATIIELMKSKCVPIWENGAITSFICPTDVFINGKTASTNLALNIVYVLPNCSTRELAYFHLLNNTYSASAINRSIENSNINTDSSLFVKNGKICGISTTDFNLGIGIGIQTVFAGDITPIDGIEFEKLVLPEGENKDTIINALHDNITTSFMVLRSFGTTSTIQYALKK